MKTKAKPKYFQTTINAKSEAERQQSIDELISRGFEVVMLKESEVEANSWQETGWRDRDGSKYRHTGCSSRKIYSAVMRRENRE